MPSPSGETQTEDVLRALELHGGVCEGLVDIWDSEVRTQRWLPQAAPTSGGPEQVRRGPLVPPVLRPHWHRCLAPGDPFFGGLDSKRDPGRRDPRMGHWTPWRRKGRGGHEAEPLG